LRIMPASLPECEASFIFWKPMVDDI